MATFVVVGNVTVISASNFNNSKNVFHVEDNKKDKVIGQAKFVDEYGNINTLDVYDGTVSVEGNLNSRKVTTENMVNFNCSAAGITTDFIDYNTGQMGYLSKSSAADAAYLGMDNGKVKFMMSGVVGLVDSKYVQIVSQGTYYASNYEVNSKGLLYHYISTNVNADGNSSGQNANANYIGKAPSYLLKGKEYYSYDGHYFYTDYNIMINDYKNNRRTNSVNYDTPYYSYYQYLPLRSKTNYTGTELTSYLNKKANSLTSKLNNTGDLFIKYQNEYGVNALLLASFAAHESGWGKSPIAQNKNNLFGLNAVDSNPGLGADQFTSVEECIKDFSKNWMSKKYLNATYTNLFRGGYLGDKASGIFGKFSSDPYEGEKIASIASNMDSGISSKDTNYYTIGIKDINNSSNTSLNVRNGSDTSSNVLYTTIKNPSYAFVVRKKEQNNGFYEIQSDSHLNANRIGISSEGNYDYTNDYGFASSKYITIVNNGNDVSYVKNTPPTITDVKVDNITSKGYTVTFKATDEDGVVTKIEMPTWTDRNGQDDIKWYTPEKTGDTYTLRVETKNHNGESGLYHTHIYAYDDSGNKKGLALDEIIVPANQMPKITDVKVDNITSVSVK